LSRVHWVEPKLVAEITYLTWTADNLLRHTAYVGLREDKPDGRLERIEAEVVRLSLANLITFPWIAEAVGAGRLAVQGYWFDVHTGVLASVGVDGLEPVE
jgi:carbonic anhydrase